MRRDSKGSTAEVRDNHVFVSVVGDVLIHRAPLLARMVAKFDMALMITNQLKGRPGGRRVMVTGTLLLRGDDLGAATNLELWLAAHGSARV
jgi:hypothetical protein